VSSQVVFREDGLLTLLQVLHLPILVRSMFISSTFGVRMYYIFEPCSHTFCVVNSIGIEVARHWTTRMHALFPITCSCPILPKAISPEANGPRCRYFAGHGSSVGEPLYIPCRWHQHCVQFCAAVQTWPTCVGDWGADLLQDTAHLLVSSFVFRAADINIMRQSDLNCWSVLFFRMSLKLGSCVSQILWFRKA